jgi:hypothetical protein
MQKMKTLPQSQPCNCDPFGVSIASMKLPLILALAVVCGSSIRAQDDGGAKLVSPVSDGSPAAPAPPKELPTFSVQATTTHRLKDRKVIMQRVADPGLPDPPAPPPPKTKEELEALRASPEWQELIAKHKETKLILLSATVVNGEATFLRWWHGGEEFQAWSNVNFHHLSGFAEFEDEKTRYAFIMAVGDVRSDGDRRIAWLGTPPDLGVDYPAFTLVKGDVDDSEGLRMMESMHDLYESERETLVAAHEARLRARAEREALLKANPPRPKDTVIQFWRREPPVKLDSTTSTTEGAE